MQVLHATPACISSTPRYLRSCDVMMSETVHSGHMTCCATPSMRRTYHRQAQSNSVAGATHCGRNACQRGTAVLLSITCTDTACMQHTVDAGRLLLAQHAPLSQMPISDPTCSSLPAYAAQPDAMPAPLASDLRRKTPMFASTSASSGLMLLHPANVRLDCLQTWHMRLGGCKKAHAFHMRMEAGQATFARQMCT